MKIKPRKMPRRLKQYRPKKQVRHAPKGTKPHMKHPGLGLPKNTKVVKKGPSRDKK